MGKVYNQGIVSPKGFNMASPEPADQRTVVEFLTDITILPQVYPGLKVVVQEVVNSIAYREYMYTGGDQTSLANWRESGTAGGGGTPTELPLKFTSFVFRRQNGAPATPVGGTYDVPVPIGWFDGPPVGSLPLWSSSAVFTQGSNDEPIWSNPILTEDNANTDYEFCNIADVPVQDVVDDLPLPPLENGTRAYWHNVATALDTHMAIGTKVGGVYPTDWKVVKIQGEQGADGGPGAEGRKYRESIVFARTNLAGMEGAIVTGGGFDSPYPSETKIGGIVVAVSWSDGVPQGDEKVWLSKFTFNDVDHAAASPSNFWTTPSATTDTATTDFEFSHELSQPQNPDTDPNAWHDIADTNDIWMATRSIANGVIGAWGITRIKGETGTAGKGLDIAGRDTITNILAKTSPPVVLYDIWLANNEELGATVPGTINDAYLWVGAGNGEAGTGWDNIGPITGTDGISYKNSYVFRRSATQPATPSGGTFADPVPAGWSDGIPNVGSPAYPVWTSNRYFASDPTANAALEDWNAPQLAQDTVDYDFKYADKQVGDVTPLPPDQATGGVWYETPTVLSYWMAKGAQTNGVVDDSTWEVIRIRGEKGEDGSDGIPSFLSSAYIKTNNDISASPVTGGTYASPVPTSTIGGDSWSDGIPAGTGAIWFTQVKFSQTDTGTKVWPAPTLIADSSIVEYNFSSSISKPAGLPIEGNDGGNTWYDDASTIEGLGGTVRWMAIGNRRNGVWPTTWDIVQTIGETGETGLSARSYVPTSRFARCDDTSIDQVNVTGQYLEETQPGLFNVVGANPTTDSPIGGFTYEFTDGIPTRTETFPNNAIRVWVIQAVMNSVDDLGAANTYSWGPPSLLADNAGVDYQYHAGATASTPGSKPAEPTGVGTNPDSTGWYDSPDLIPLPNYAFWIAQKNYSEGVSAQWKIYQIRGEDGDSGIVYGPPGTPTGLKIYRDGNQDRAVWNPTLPSDPSLTIDSYELEELDQGIGTFISTQTTLIVSAIDQFAGGLYTFRVRAVQSDGQKGDWSISNNYVPPAVGIYGWVESTDSECGTSIPPAYPSIYLLGSDGRNLDANYCEAFYNIEKKPGQEYPAGDLVVDGFVSTEPNIRTEYQVRVIGGGAVLVLGECLGGGGQ